MNSEGQPARPTDRDRLVQLAWAAHAFDEAGTRETYERLVHHLRQLDAEALRSPILLRDQAWTALSLAVDAFRTAPADAASVDRLRAEAKKMADASRLLAESVVAVCSTDSGGPRDGGARRSRFAFALSVLAVVGILAIVGFTVLGGDEDPHAKASTDPQVVEVARASGFGDAASVELPEPEDESARQWLEGEGSAAVRMVTATLPLWRDGSGSCAGVRTELDAAAAPPEMLAAASGTPDPATAELLIDVHAATVDALRACSEEANFGEAQSVFAWQWALADRRLDELGVAR